MAAAASVISKVALTVSIHVLWTLSMSCGLYTRSIRLARAELNGTDMDFSDSMDRAPSGRAACGLVPLLICTQFKLDAGRPY